MTVVRFCDMTRFVPSHWVPCGADRLDIDKATARLGFCNRRKG